MIAAVEDARAAQEREAERLRDKLSGFGKTLTPLAPRTNGTTTAAANGGTLREFSIADGDADMDMDMDAGGRDDGDLIDSAEVSLVVHPILIFCLPFLCIL